MAESVEFENVLLMDERDLSYQFDIGDSQHWVPKSLCVWTPSDDDEVEGTLEVQRWFAEKEGMI